MTTTLPFRGFLESAKSWKLGEGASATLVHPATGIVLTQGVPIEGDGRFSAAIDSNTVGRVIARLARLGRTSPQIEVEVRVETQGAGTTRSRAVWSPTASDGSNGIVTFRLDRGGEELTAETPYAVYGTLDGLKEGAIVSVLVPGSPTFAEVGRSKVGDDGSYRVEYRTSGNASGPDVPILVRVEHNGATVHESDSLCTVPAVLEYDAQVGERIDVPALFSRLVAASDRIPAQGGLSDAEVNAVACLLDVEPDDVRRYYLAVDFERDHCAGTPVEVIFGIAFGAGIVAEEALRGLEPRAFVRHWATAVTAHAVEARTERELEAFLAAFARCIIDAQLDASTRSPLGEVVESLDLRSVSSRDFLRNLLFEHDGAREAYLDVFEREAPEEEARRVRFAFDLWPLLGDVDALRLLLSRRGDTLTLPQDVAGLSEAQWQQLLGELDRDHTFDGAVAEAYAAALEQAYPTHATLRRLDNAGHFPAAASYLRANPTLDIVHDRIREFVARDGATAADDDTLAELETVQRLVRIVPRIGASTSVRELVEANYTSAFAIAKTPWQRFRGDLNADAPDEKIRAIYQGARRTAMWVMNAAVAVHQARFAPNFKILEPEDEPDDPDAIDLRGLFNSLDHCYCEPCRSVLSPAAYLVALLEFVHDQVSPAAYNELIARRPWIAQTLLDCDNAMTSMSKLDLINELLEAEVNPPGATAVAPQTTWTAQRLTAEPEHIDREAYDRLADATAYPWTLPFDLDTEEIATLLEPVGVVWGELLSAFGATNTAAVRAAWLGLSSAGLELVEAAADDQRAERWDGAFPVPDVRGGIAAFVRTMQTDLEHFEGLANTWFVGRLGLAMDWATGDDPCSLDDARLHDGATFEACMVAAERFERVRRATSWSIVQLDEALQAFAQDSEDGRISTRATMALAEVQRLHRRFEDLDVAELVSWFRVPTHPRAPGDDVAFERLFGPVDRFDTLGGDDPAWLEVVAGAIGTEVAVVVDAFGVDEDGNLPEVDGGVLPLSQLRGLAALAKALGTTLADLNAFVRLCGVQPFGVGPAEASEGTLAEAPAAVLAFVDLWDRWIDVNADLADLTRALDVTSSEATAEAAGFFAALQQAREGVDASIDLEEGATPHERIERLLPRLFGDVAGAALVEVLVRPQTAQPLGLDYPEWVAVTELNAALTASPIDEDELDQAGEAILARTIVELGATARAAAHARLAQQLIEGSFVSDTEVGAPIPTDDDRALLGRARLLRALAPLALHSGWLDLVLAEPPGWLHASQLDSSVATTRPQAFAAWLAIATAVAFDARTDGAFHPVLASHLEGTVGDDTSWNADLGALLSMAEADVTAALSDASASLPPTAEELSTLLAMQRLSERVGASVTRMREWSSSAPSDVVGSVRDAVRSRFDPEVWYAKSASARDRLRARQRDALVAFLTTRGSQRQPGRDFSTVQRISDALLIDVQSEPCQSSSRIVEATLAVQSFAFRIQLRLEPAVPDFPASAARQWTWLKNYRVWEAAKKIFLFPENYLEADFRADKTPLFDAFVNTVSSANVDDEVAERAFTAYAEGLHAISFLRPAGIVYDDGHEDPANNILHVVAHDRSDPPTYFHRQRVLNRWTPWQEVPGGMPNQGVLPVVRRGRLSLYWPSIEPEELLGQDLAKDERPWQSATIALSWVERAGEGWQAERRSVRKLSARSLVRQNEASGRDELKSYFTRTFAYALHEDRVDRSVLHLAAVRPTGAMVYEIGEFWSGACSGEWNVRHAPGSEVVWDPSNTKRRGQRFRFGVDGDVDIDAVVNTGMTHAGNFQRLLRTPRPFEYVCERRGSRAITYRPFMFTDTDRSFVVLAERRRRQPPPQGGGTMMMIDTTPEAIRFGHAVASAAGHAVGSTELANPEREIPPLDPYERVWRFVPFSHELVCDVVQALGRHGIDGVFDPQLPSILARQRGDVGNTLAQIYEPSDKVVAPFPKRTFDFEPSAPYGTYNWELFFHAPAYTALQLANQGQFSEAQRWWHFIFNPQEPFGNAPTGARRFWRVKPLAVGPRSIEEILRNLAAGDEGDESLRTETLAALDDWINHPFDAHGVAARRPGSYQRWVVARYLDLLIAWGDSLYRQFTRESINEAAQLYVIAAQLLGPKPERLSGRPVEPRTYAQLRDNLDESGNALVALENVAPLGLAANPVRMNTALPVVATVFPQLLNPLRATTVGSLTSGADLSPDTESFFVGPSLPDALRTGEDELEVARLDAVLDDLPLGYWAGEQAEQGLYFCIPPNPVFDQYWDQVGQRLFNIRNCRDLDGNLRELALFAPPIDPKLLARASASGLDVGAAISELSAPIPLYRFHAALALAKEVAAEVKTLGSAMLSALQAADGEELAELRARQEVRNLDQIRTARAKQIEEAETAIVSLQLAKTTAEQRAEHYRELFGDEVPSKGELGIGESRELEAEAQQRDLLVDSRERQAAGGKYALAAGVLQAIPDFDLGFSFGAHTTATFGGRHIAAAINAAATAENNKAGYKSTNSTLAGFKASQIRREQDWHLQLRQAEREIIRIEQDLVAAQIRLQVAKHELDNHDFAREQSQAVETYLTRRFTNAELHRWMAGELAATYSKAYGFALDLARRAERCFQFELGKPGVTFVRAGRFVGQRKGLLAGNELVADLQRLESEYQVSNVREHELIKRVSLAEIDPWALVQLRESGECEIVLDESLFDLDHPGHYFRRIKMVRVSLPTVTGPYVSTAGRLTLLSSLIRTEGMVGSELFSAQPGGTTSVALSTGHDDSGMLEPNLRDDRYLPFEGKGAVGRWSLRLPRARSFDYRTIADVVLEIQYTARDGDAAFREAVENELSTRLLAREHNGALDEAPTVGPSRAWSLRAAFPEALDALREGGEATLVLSATAVPMQLSGEGPAEVLASTVLLMGGPEDTEVSLSTETEAELIQTAPFTLPDGGETNVRFAVTGSGDWVGQPLTLRASLAGEATALDDVVLLLTFGV